MALLIHAQTRKKELIDKLKNLGLCISYDRVLQVSTELGNTVCAFYEETNNVCPPKLRNGLFTTGCVDNVSTSSIPSNWHSFLRSNENKAELFLFLAHQIKDINIEGKQIISTAEEDVASFSPIDTTGLAPCSHEEADTRLLLHVAQGIRCDFDKVIIRTVDTDVVILSIANFHNLGPTELWISFGAGKHHRYIPAHQIAVNVGEEKCRALTIFHAFTGCDTVSAFSGKGKKSAFDL